MNEPIAERNLLLTKKDGTVGNVRISIGKPRQDENEDWWCDIEITGLEEPFTFSSIGQDSLEAIDRAMDHLNKRIDLMESMYGQAIAWHSKDWKEEGNEEGIVQKEDGTNVLRFRKGEWLGNG